MEDKKPNLLKRLYNWTISWAEKPQGLWALAILSFGGIVVLSDSAGRSADSAGVRRA